MVLPSLDEMVADVSGGIYNFESLSPVDEFRETPPCLNATQLLDLLMCEN